MTPHRKRIATGLVLVLLLVAVLYLLPGPFLYGAVFVLSALGLWEFYSLFWPQGKNLLYKLWGIGLAFPITCYSLLGLPLSFGLVLALWSANMLFLVAYSRDSSASWPELQVLSAGLLYIPVALQFLGLLREEEILLVLLAAFLTDTGGFYAGSRWGRRRLWPSVSPKKTWAGSAGGLAACVGICLLIGLWQGHAAWFHWLWVGLLLNLAAQFGDFFESALKRRLEVKDSGIFLPGHGGILDRFDSVLFVLPLYMGLRVIYPLF
jgi:phosphatidate cytidylyltransferase